jgi:hypothetical protein
MNDAEYTQYRVRCFRVRVHSETDTKQSCKRILKYYFYGLLYSVKYYEDVQKVREG